MSTVTFKGNPIAIRGKVPGAGDRAPGFSAVKTDLSTISLSDFIGSPVVLNIFPSLDTSVCANSVRTFNQKAGEQAQVLCLSRDLPFAMKRFCEAEGIANVTPASVFRDPSLGTGYGLDMIEGPLAGLLARAVLVVDADGVVTYSQLVPEIAQEPDYDAALAAL